MMIRRKWGRILGQSLFVVFWFLATNYLGSFLLFAFYKESWRSAQMLSLARYLVITFESRQWVIFFLLCFPLLLVGLIFPIRLVLSRMRRRRAGLVHGGASFAKRGDVKKAGLFSDSGVILGRLDSRIIRFPGNEFVLLAAPTRSGKGVGFCIPNLLTYTQSMVVLDIKGENYEVSARYRADKLGNEVILFNPYSAATSCWNPLDFVSRDQRYIYNDLMMIATIIYPDQQGANTDPFWSMSARNLFIGIAMMILETPELPQTLGEILRQGSGFGFELNKYLTHVMEVRNRIGNPLSDNCLGCLRRYIGAGDVTGKSIYAIFAGPLSIFSSEIVDKATSRSDFALENVRKKLITIYVVIPASKVQQAAFLANLFFSQLIDANIKELPEQNANLRYQCLLLLDEFTSMGKMPIMAKAIGFIAGYNLRLAIIIQDRAQLKSVYGEQDAHNIVSNMGATLQYTPTQYEDAERLSKSLGNVTKESLSTTYSNFRLIKILPSKSEAYNSQSVPLMMAADLLSMSMEKAIVIMPGNRAIYADKIRYYKENEFLNIVKRYPRLEVAKEEAGVGYGFRPERWDEYFNTITDSKYYLQTRFSEESLVEDDSSGGDELNF